jgi:hypothetical protein
MHWLLVLAALIASYQPQPRPAEQPNRSEEALKAFELFCAIAKTSEGLADDHIDDGASLLFYRAARFVHDYGKAGPAEAIKAAAIVSQLPEVKALGARLNTRPVEIEKREGVNASADQEWVTSRLAALAGTQYVGPVGMLVTDLNLPLPGRTRFDVLSVTDREDQSKVRWMLLVTALQSYRNSSGNPANLSDDDSMAASKLVQEQLDRDYIKINGYYVRVRGHANACALIDVNAVAKAILDWVGPALIELEAVKNITLAPVESGWVVVDADTGWSLKDPTIGKFSNRDVLMLQKGLQALPRSNSAITEGPSSEAHRGPDKNTIRPLPQK